MMSIKSIFFSLIAIGCNVKVKSDTSHLPDTHQKFDVSDISINENLFRHNVVRNHVAQDLIKIQNFASEVNARFNLIKNYKGLQPEQRLRTDQLYAVLLDSSRNFQSQYLRNQLGIDQIVPHLRIHARNLNELNAYLLSILDQHPELREQEQRLLRARAQQRLAQQLAQRSSELQPLINQQAAPAVASQQLVQQQQQQATLQQQPATASGAVKRTSLPGPSALEQGAQKTRRLDSSDRTLAQGQVRQVTQRRVSSQQGSTYNTG